MRLTSSSRREGATKNSRYAWIHQLSAHRVAHLLIDISALGSPTVHVVIAASAIDSRLTVDRQESKLVHLGKLLRNDTRFARWRLRRPRQLSEVGPAETCEQVGDVLESFRVTPKFVSVIRLDGSAVLG